jgi:hypothetical protein
MPEAELARRVDVSRRTHSLLDKTDRPDDNSVQEPIEGETSLTRIGVLPTAVSVSENLVDEDGVGVHRRITSTRRMRVPETKQAIGAPYPPTLAPDPIALLDDRRARTSAQFPTPSSRRQRRRRSQTTT